MCIRDRLYDPLGVVLQNIAATFNTKLQIERMRSILEQPVQTGTENFHPDRYDITFDHVSFAYREGAGVLEDVSFTARPVSYTHLDVYKRQGIMFGNVIGGITNYLSYKYEMTQAMSSWLVGHFSIVLSGNYELVWLSVPLVVLAFVFANHFNIVGMGKDFSKNLGVPYNLVLFLGLSIAAMITASVGGRGGEHLLHRAHSAQHCGHVQRG